MPYEPSEVVVIRFPFTSHEGAKQRPAVVISSTDYNTKRPDTVLIAVTSRIRTPLGFGEALIQDWRSAQLLKPSVIKPVIFTVEQRLIRKPLGRLSDRDHHSLQELLRLVLRRQN